MKPKRSRPRGEPAAPARPAAKPLAARLQAAVVAALPALAGAALAAWWVFTRVSLARGPLLTWDEGRYVWKAHFTAQALALGDFSMLWKVWNADAVNPFLHPVLLAGVLRVFGDTPATAFAFSAVSLVACALLLWTIARDLGGWIAGAVAVLCLLGSRLFLECSATALMELPGVALTLLAIVLYLRHEKAPSAASAWIAGGALLGVFLYKYNFGLLLGLGIAGNEAFRRPFRPLGPATRGLWIPLIAGAALWFLLPGTLRGFLDFAGNRDTHSSVIESLIFYPRALIGSYAAWAPGGVLILAGALAALAWWKREPVRFLALFALLGLGGMTIHHYKLERSIVTLAPALWILCGVSCAEMVGWARRRAPALGVAAAAVVALVLAAGLPTLYARDLPAIARHIEDRSPHPWSRFPWPGRDLLPVRDLILKSVDPAMPVLVGGEFNELPPAAIHWWLDQRYPGLPVVGQAFMSDVRLPYPLNLVTLEVEEGSPYLTDDFRAFNAKALDSIHTFERSGAKPEIDSLFAAAGVRVKVYRLRDTP